MIKFPLLYTFLLCRVKKVYCKKTNEVFCKKTIFRSMLSQPLGIDRKLAEFLLRDMKKYGLIKKITRGKRGIIYFTKIKDNPQLKDDFNQLRRIGLL